MRELSRLKAEIGRRLDSITPVNKDLLDERLVGLKNRRLFVSVGGWESRRRPALENVRANLEERRLRVVMGVFTS